MFSKTRVRVLTVGIVGVVLGILLGGSSCDAPQTDAQKAAEEKARTGNTFIPVNDVERKVYNKRAEQADNPASLIWCSLYPTNPNVKPFTVPIVGKLVSGSKRPYQTEVVHVGGDQDYYPERADPNGMYGSSADYRYGYDPAGNYWEFTDIEMTCSSVPTVIQKATTQIAITATGDLSTLDATVQRALEKCQERNGKDPTQACPEAARLLGI